jgi:hypothetical protein
MDNVFGGPDEEAENYCKDSSGGSHYLIERASEKFGGAKVIRTPDVLHAMRSDFV